MMLQVHNEYCIPDVWMLFLIIINLSDLFDV